MRSDDGGTWVCEDEGFVTVAWGPVMIGLDYEDFKEFAAAVSKAAEILGQESHTASIGLIG